MPQNTLVSQSRIREENVVTNVESLHWLVQFGEINLSRRENMQIKEFNLEMNIILRLLIDIYKHSIMNAEIIQAEKIISFFSRLIDPYIPSICYDNGFDNSNDIYLDYVDIRRSDPSEMMYN